jgi:hypothetical protein
LQLPFEGNARPDSSADPDGVKREQQEIDGRIANPAMYRAAIQLPLNGAAQGLSLMAHI